MTGTSDHIDIYIIHIKKLPIYNHLKIRGDETSSQHLKPRVI